MKIIGLIGKSNSGKTSSLKYLILNLLDLDEIKILYSSRLFSESPKQLKENILNNWKTETGHIKDITVLLEYKGKKIGITTYGDSLNDILSALNTIIKRFDGCDIFVCSRHENNSLEEEFYDYNIDKFYSIPKERSSSDENYNGENISTGSELIDCILNEIN